MAADLLSIIKNFYYPGLALQGKSYTANKVNALNPEAPDYIANIKKEFDAYLTIYLELYPEDTPDKKESSLLLNCVTQAPIILDASKADEREVFFAYLTVQSCQLLLEPNPLNEYELLVIPEIKILTSGNVAILSRPAKNINREPADKFFNAAKKVTSWSKWKAKQTEHLIQSNNWYGLSACLRGITKDFCTEMTAFFEEKNTITNTWTNDFKIIFLSLAWQAFTCCCLLPSSSLPSLMRGSDFRHYSNVSQKDMSSAISMISVEPNASIQEILQTCTAEMNKALNRAAPSVGVQKLQERESELAAKGEAHERSNYDNNDEKASNSSSNEGNEKKSSGFSLFSCCTKKTSALERPLIPKGANR